MSLEDETSERIHRQFGLMLSREEEKKKESRNIEEEKKTRRRIAFFRCNGTKEN